MEPADFGVQINKAIGQSDVHVNRPLTNVSVAYMQNTNDFIANRIFPVVSVSNQSDTFWKFDRADWNRNEMKLRADATESAGVTFNLSQDSYYCPVYAVHHEIGDQLRANADSFLQLDRAATELITRKALIFQEVIWANSFFKTGVWNTLKTGLAATPGANQFLQWNDAASEPGKDIKSWKADIEQATGFTPNVLVLGSTTYRILSENDAIIDRIKYGQTPGSPAIATKSAMAQLFEVDRIEVLKGIVNSGPEGGTESNAYIAAAKSAALFYAAPSAGLMVPSAGYTFAWTGYLGANAMGGRVSQFRRELVRSDRFEIELAFAPKVVAPDLGVFATAAVA